MEGVNSQNPEAGDAVPAFHSAREDLAAAVSQAEEALRADSESPGGVALVEEKRSSVEIRNDKNGDCSGFTVKIYGKTGLDAATEALAVRDGLASDLFNR